MGFDYSKYCLWLGFIQKILTVTKLKNNDVKIIDCYVIDSQVFGGEGKHSTLLKIDFTISLTI